MSDNESVLQRLSQLIRQKQSKAFYAKKLGITEEEVHQLLSEMKYQEQKETAINAKILVLDIETSPLLAYVYQKSVWKAKITHQHVVSDWFMLSWAAKWLGSKEVMSDVLTPMEALEENDRRLLNGLWVLLNDADIVIVHNCQFDIPNINTRFVLYGFIPPSPYKQIDTLKVAQNQFGFTHNGLDALAQFFGMEGKLHTDFDLWKRCIRGEEQALFYLEKYNKKDVVVLEKVYYKLRPFIKGHPNLDLYNDGEDVLCPSCEKDALVELSGKYFYTQAVRYKIYQCSECGSISRSKKGVPFLKSKKVSAIPR